MGLSRLCSRTGCRRPAVATLTYVYSDSTAVVGPLATYAEPHTYDLCAEHGERLTAPRGWDIVRLPGEYVPAPPSEDDLLALANAVREAARPRTRPVDPAAVTSTPRPTAGSGPLARSLAGPGAARDGAREPTRRGHLRALADPDS